MQGVAPSWVLPFPLDFCLLFTYFICQKQKARERSLNMLLMSTMVWILIGVAVVILAVVIGAKIKDRYF